MKSLREAKMLTTKNCFFSSTREWVAIPRLFALSPIASSVSVEPAVQAISAPPGVGKVNPELFGVR